MLTAGKKQARLLSEDGTSRTILNVSTVARRVERQTQVKLPRTNMNGRIRCQPQVKLRAEAGKNTAYKTLAKKIYVTFKRRAANGKLERTMNRSSEQTQLQLFRALYV